VPLEYLLLIQKALGNCHLQDFFDQFIGTSSGIVPSLRKV
jgi:hypothetical protein